MVHSLKLVILSLALPVFSSLIDFTAKSTTRRSPLHTSLARRQSTNDTGSGLDLTTVRDLIYMSEMTAGGKDFVVQMDTGSSDLWLKADAPPLTNAEQTSLTTNLTFGIGWVFGTVSYIPVEFAGTSVSKQAYVDVTQADNPALSYNADGLIGLGFTSLSTVDSLLNGTGSSDGRSLLYNLFEDNPDDKNFIAFSFQRSTDSTDEVQGGFSIGEYETNYTAIETTATIPTWPVNSPKRWTLLVEAFIIGSNTVLPTTTVDDAPGNKGVALLDTGTSYSYVSKEICDGIYGSVDGASYDESTGYYNVPCDVEIDMAIQIGGRVFPLHPLDINPSSYEGDNTCIGSFVPASFTAGEGQFDYIFGVNALRSVYSLYDFGDFDSNGNMGTPYMKLLSLVDPDTASQSFCEARNCTAKTDITYQVSSNTYNGPANGVSITASEATAIENFSTYFPVMLAIMALNAVVLLGVLILGIVLLCRKCRKRRGATRVPAARLNLRNSSSPSGGNGQPHTYEPVSMAMTEDTMVPPSPAFHRFEGSTLKAGDRPKSLATLPSNSKYDDDTEDALLSPASPGFKQYDVRPRSVGILPSQGNTYQKIGEDEPFTPPGRLDGVPESPESPTPKGTRAQSVRSGRSPSPSSFRQHPSDDTIAPPSPTPSSHSQQQQQQLQQLHGAALMSPYDPEQTPLPPSPSANSFRDSARPNSHYVDAPSRPTSRYVDAPSRPSSRYVPEPPQRSMTPVIQLSEAPVPPGGGGRPSPLNNVFDPAAFGEDQDLAPPSPSFQSRSDRPRSVGMLPSQASNNPYARAPAQNSTLRPGANSSNDPRPMSSFS